MVAVGDADGIVNVLNVIPPIDFARVPRKKTAMARHILLARFSGGAWFGLGTGGQADGERCLAQYFGGDAETQALCRDVI